MLLCWGFSGFASAADLRLAVAANFTDVTRELITAFRESSGYDASASFGSTGKLYAQILNGAPYHVFLAADAERPRRLEQEEAGVPGTRFTYAQGQLVLWSPKPGLFVNGEQWLASAPLGRIAIANPKTAPYGAASQQVLESLNLWDTLQPKLVRGDSIAQTFQFVATSNAKAGFLALSQVQAWDPESGSLWRIPPEHYSPINQQAILLKQGRNNNAAREWLTFLASETAREIIRRFGYSTP